MQVLTSPGPPGQDEAVVAAAARGRSREASIATLQTKCVEKGPRAHLDGVHRGLHLCRHVLGRYGRRRVRAALAGRLACGATADG